EVGEGKGKEAKLRERQSIRNRKNDRDRISELPITVLLHIMEFMNTNEAIKTCVLSKHWKDIWKSLTSLKLDSSILGVANFDKFVSGVLSSRDASISLLNLHIVLHHCIDFELLHDIMEYAVLHNVQNLTLIIFVHYKFHFVFPSVIYFCSSLTNLHLSHPFWELPKSLQLPALKTLHLENACFTSPDNDFAEPFSSCVSLNSLHLIDCSLVKHSKALCINNSNLQRLHLSLTVVDTYKIVLSTPNLTCLAIKNFYCEHQLSSPCNLSFLEVFIDASLRFDSPFFVILLQVLANVKKMTLSSRTIKTMRRVLSYGERVKNPLPCLVRLESLQVNIESDSKISYREVNRIVKYLLQNSPLTTVQMKDFKFKKLLVEKVNKNLKQCSEHMRSGVFEGKGRPGKLKLKRTTI
ncbi:FBD-associated F-box protein, partial [Mucuna pruriens]